MMRKHRKRKHSCRYIFSHAILVAVTNFPVEYIRNRILFEISGRLISEVLSKGEDKHVLEQPHLAGKTASRLPIVVSMFHNDVTLYWPLNCRHHSPIRDAAFCDCCAAIFTAKPNRLSGAN